MHTKIANLLHLKLFILSVFLLFPLFYTYAQEEEEAYAQYEKVTNIENYERYLIVAECDGKYYCAQNVFNNSGKYYTSTEITLDKNNQIHYYPLGIDGFEFSSKSDGYKIFSYADRKYYTISNKVLTSTGQASEVKNAWYLTFQADKKANISLTETIKTVATTYTIVFDKSTKRFIATKAPINDNYTLPYIFGKVSHLVANITVSNTHWTTFYADFDIKLPSPPTALAYTISNIDEKGNINLERIKYINIKKHSPILIYSEQPCTFPCYETTTCFNTVDLSSSNYLRGTSSDQMIEGEEGYSYYMLTYGTINDNKVFGFFYGAENGAPFVNKGGKSYLAVPTTIANNAMGFSLTINNNEVTNIERINNSNQKSHFITTISGIKLNNTNVKQLPKGIYIVNGKKIIVK